MAVLRARSVIGFAFHHPALGDRNLVFRASAVDEVRS
jgi:hypothetical protein